MKFFTPPLYIRYNSGDDAVDDRADRAWERAIRIYREHLKTFSEKMNDRVKGIAETLNLQDAEILSLQPNVPARPLLAPPSFRDVTTFSLRSDGKIVNLLYLLWDETANSAPPKHWPFSDRRIHWRYDEIDCVGAPWPPFIWHRILLSDGRVISIPFTDVVVSSFSVEHPQVEMVTHRRS